MSDQITIRAFFGDRTRAFALTDPMLAELERLTDLGAGALFFQMANLGYPTKFLCEIIRLGLIGGGETSPEEAALLCAAYTTNRPVAELLSLAAAIMAARWYGVEDGSLETDETAADKMAA
ncbi:gene transfer agent family protein [Salipiger bermudensis]|uniref:gene transfer agent family protein n=1 Tax=Salipiger bermudensis TaxID=344736 RepID=UPI001CD73B51|nr:gene transfer agent family protein [Salipiger bermudensis]MCA1286254.1 gene transfer agent family protein [Salipiger bermudensis]